MRNGSRPSARSAPRKRLSGIAVALGVLSLALAGPAFATDSNSSTQPDSQKQYLESNLERVPSESGAVSGSDVEGHATLVADGTSVHVHLELKNLAPYLPLAQHIHGVIGKTSVCPPASAAGAKGIISTPDGQPFYGGILVSLTTSGDTSPASALALDRMPVADAHGNLVYDRTIELSPDEAAQVGNFAIVNHGIDINSSGTYDGPIGPLGGAPAEATTPNSCGTIHAQSAADRHDGENTDGDHHGTTTTTTPPTTAPPTTTTTTMPAPPPPAVNDPEPCGQDSATCDGIGLTDSWYNGKTINLNYSHPYFCGDHSLSQATTGCEIGAATTVQPPNGLVVSPIYVMTPLGFTPANLQCPVEGNCIDHPMTVDASRILGPSTTNALLPPHSHIIVDREDALSSWWPVIVIGVNNQKAWDEIAEHKDLKEVQKIRSQHPDWVTADVPSNIYLYFQAVNGTDNDSAASGGAVTNR